MKTRIKLSIKSFVVFAFAIALFLLTSTIFPLFGGDQVLAPTGGNYAFIYGLNFIGKFFSDLLTLFAFQGNIITSISLYLVLGIFLTAVVFTILKFRFIMFIPTFLLLVEGAIALIVMDFFFNQFLYYEGVQVNYLTLLLLNSSMNLLVLIYYWLDLIITFIGVILLIALFITIILSPKKVKNEKEVLKKEQFETSYPTVKEVREVIKEELENYFNNENKSDEADKDSVTEEIINNAKEDKYTL